MNRLACATHGALLAMLLVASCDRGGHSQDSPGTTRPGVAPTGAGDDVRASGCAALPDAGALRSALREAPGLGEAGGLAGGRKEWAAVVDRQGELCAVVVSTADAAAAWPGSQGIAKAKAYTANAFSTDDVPLSTARLYTMAQPGAALYGLANGNPLDPRCLSTPDHHDARDPRLCGGTIVFGGGLPLYKGGKRVGGLGASGDTACADHEIAKRIRDKLALNPPGGAFVDDITYSSVDGASVYTHPLCPNTWRNQQKIGDPPPPSGY